MMNKFARMLSHGFAIAVVALLALAFIYRGELFPDWELPKALVPDAETVVKGDDKATSGKVARAPGEQSEEAVAVVTEQQGAEPERAEAVEMAVAPKAELGATMPPEVEAPESPAGEAGQQDAAPEEDVASDAEQAAESAVEVPGGDAGREAVAAPPEPQEAVAAVTGAMAPVPAPVDIPASMSRYQLLAVAREAFWLRDYDRAEESYRLLMQLEPDNPDGYGELGNMFFSQGRWEEAAAAYYEAGTRLMKTGHSHEARLMVDVIRGLGGDQAERLEQEITRAEK